MADAFARRVARPQVDKEAAALRASEGAALTQAGSSSEEARLARAKADECRKGAGAAAERIGRLSAQLGEVSALNQSCATELGRHAAYLTAVDLCLGQSRSSDL